MQEVKKKNAEMLLQVFLNELLEKCLNELPDKNPEKNTSGGMSTGAWKLLEKYL